MEYWGLSPVVNEQALTEELANILTSEPAFPSKFNKVVEKWKELGALDLKELVKEKKVSLSEKAVDYIDTDTSSKHGQMVSLHYQGTTVSHIDGIGRSYLPHQGFL